MWKSSSTKERLIATLIIYMFIMVIGLFFVILGYGQTAVIIISCVGICFMAYVWIVRNDKPEDKPLNEYPQKKINKEVDVRDKPYAMATLRYLGGGTINKEKNVPIVVTIRGLKYGSEFIPIERITATAIETQSQILSRISATRMVAFGVFSLAMPKRKQKTQKFLTVDYDHGFQSTLIFEGKTIVKVNSALIKAKQMSKYY